MTYLEKLKLQWYVKLASLNMLHRKNNHEPTPKTLQLLQEKRTCVVIKILSSKDPEYPLGTVLVVTSKESWGNYPLIQNLFNMHASP